MHLRASNADRPTLSISCYQAPNLHHVDLALNPFFVRLERVFLFSCFKD